MTDQEPATQTLEISDIEDQLSSLIDAVSRNETRVLVEKEGVPVAAIVSADDLKHLAYLDAERAERRRLLELLREPFRGVDPDELEREAERAITAVRAEKRAARERAKTAATSA